MIDVFTVIVKKLYVKYSPIIDLFPDNVCGGIFKVIFYNWLEVL